MINRIGHALFAVTALVALVGAFGASSSSAATLTGEYAVFDNCPLSHEPLGACMISKTMSGEVTLGKQTVPIVAPQTLQGGFYEEEDGELKFVGAEGAETFPKTPQKVPGGLAGLVACNEIKGSKTLEVAARATCELVFENGLTGVNATTELAVPAGSIGLNEKNIETEKGVGLLLPVKVKLENPLLGSECYIGSNSEPIKLELTTGTTNPKAPNTPIKGKLGTLSDKAEGGILVISNNTLVENNFRAPAATGCGGILLSPVIDPIVNAKIGLPSPEGTNTAVLNNQIEQASRLIIEAFGE